MLKLTLGHNAVNYATHVSSVMQVNNHLYNSRAMVNSLAMIDSLAVINSPALFAKPQSATDSFVKNQLEHRICWGPSSHPRHSEHERIPLVSWQLVSFFSIQVAKPIVLYSVPLLLIIISVASGYLRVSRLSQRRNLVLPAVVDTYSVQNTTTVDETAVVGTKARSVTTIYPHFSISSVFFQCYLGIT